MRIVERTGNEPKLHSRLSILSVYLLSFVKTPRKFMIAELSIRKLGSSSVLIIPIIISAIIYRFVELVNNLKQTC